METNIPIYRAKKIDSDEYVIGWYSSPIIIEGKLYLSITNKDGEHRIDTTTLSIHFPDMLDSQENKIFASLQEDGKGGDIIESEFKHKCTVKYKEYFFYADNEEIHINCFGFKNSKVIGIQE
jgi:hypothetical protein